MRETIILSRIILLFDLIAHRAFRIYHWHSLLSSHINFVKSNCSARSILPQYLIVREVQEAMNFLTICSKFIFVVLSAFNIYDRSYLDRFSEAISLLGIHWQNTWLSVKVHILSLKFALRKWKSFFNWLNLSFVGTDFNNFRRDTEENSWKILF